MSVIEKKLKDRSNSVCEISGAEHDLVVYTLPHFTTESVEHSVLLTKNLKDQVENPETTNENYWRGLSESMWSEHLPVQILSWRMLARLKNNDLLEMMYLDEEALEWAKATGEGEEEEGREAKVRRGGPSIPTKQREEHEATLVPFRSWCRHCVWRRGRNTPHKA